MGRKIGFTGADSTGKSTLIKTISLELKDDFRIANLVIGDIARSSPYPLVDRQNICSSNWILDQVQVLEFSLQRTSDILICDRTALDIWIFSNLAASLGNISSDQLNLFCCRIRKALRDYHSIFYTMIDDKIPVRAENLPTSELRIREKFEEILLSSIEEFQDETSFIRLPSSYKKCTDIVISTLK
jgi:nicotinamide riboside kinase